MPGSMVSGVMEGGVPPLYTNISHNTSKSLNLGVRPPRTTLSEQAMHSTMSPERYAVRSVLRHVEAVSNCHLHEVQEEHREDPNVLAELTLKPQYQHEGLRDVL
eukprot:CAMPEP_0115600282 /NCGR_PEP_ID=MMETSP0272-20121206/14814_1 /TAXON_ID=71861 /ORGANISM="Scrippsiella trochoidea, Strain CCMP3099" /LENGTH=103 /DNA_ID=CAMNT_0003035733 /DNA_START=229 /DNA_END=535 /DNA_ORIENTATION=+